MLSQEELKEKYFDTYYDVSTAIYDRITEEMDRIEQERPYSEEGLARLEEIRKPFLDAASIVLKTSPEKLLRELENIRKRKPKESKKDRTTSESKTVIHDFQI